MPELPEVQTVVDGLNRKIKDWKIISFWTEWEKAIGRGKSALEFEREIRNRKVLRAERRAKNILIFLSGGKVLLIHLKMTGHLLIKPLRKKLERAEKFQPGTLDYLPSSHFSDRVNGYIRHAWLLEEGGRQASLEFSDLRKFGKIELIDESDLTHHKRLGALGVEPLGAHFTAEKLAEIFRRKKNSPLKTVLLDQTLIAGIGNIYASEIPFAAAVSPERKAGSLSDSEVQQLHRQTRKVLERAVKMRGTSDSDYRDTDGAPGGFQKVLKVYNREKEKCLRRGCSGVIKRKKVGQRSTFFCDVCQK